MVEIKQPQRSDLTDIFHHGSLHQREIKKQKRVHFLKQPHFTVNQFSFSEICF